jgi:hypothetical protein
MENDVFAASYVDMGQMQKRKHTSQNNLHLSNGKRGLPITEERALIHYVLGK